MENNLINEDGSNTEAPRDYTTNSELDKLGSNNSNSDQSSVSITEDATEVDPNKTLNTNVIIASNKDDSQLIGANENQNSLNNVSSNNEGKKYTKKIAKSDENFAHKDVNFNKSSIVSNDANQVVKLLQYKTTLNTNGITTSDDNAPSNLGSNHKLDEALNSKKSTNKTANMEDNCDYLEMSADEVNSTEKLSMADLVDSKNVTDNPPNSINMQGNDDNSVNNNNIEDGNANELSRTQKEALQDLINEIEDEDSDNISEKSSKQSENITIKASRRNNNKIKGNNDNFTNNNTKEQNKSLNAANFCDIDETDDDDKKSSIEGSTASADKQAVEIKCEIDCDALLDDVKDEIVGDDYNIPDNFLELAEHFLKNEARVVLQRVVVYKCPQCPRVFTSRGQRALHKAKHIAEEVLSEQRKHVSTDPRFIKRYQCPECDLRFVLESTLETHMAIHRPYPYICDCGVGYTKLTDLEQHEKIVHNKIKVETNYTSTWKPIINLKKTKRSEISRKRLKKETEVKEPEETPERTYSRYGRTLKRFVNIKEEKTKLEYSSEDLDDETVYQHKEKKAKRKVKTQEQIKAENGRLDNKEHRKQQKSQNKVAVRNASKGPFICSICDRELKTYHIYLVHLQSHDNLRSYKCQICEKGFNSSTGLRNHMQTHLENKFKCAFCDKTFCYKQNRQTHEYIHMGLKQFACGYCDSSFTDPSALKRHVRIHTGVKPYKCEYCPKAYSDASQAIVHRRRHKGERNFACRYCDKRFLVKSNLNLHEELHVNDFKFECDLCSEKFQLKRYLESHIKGMHDKRRKVKCSICSKKMYKVSYARHKLDVHGVRMPKKWFEAPVEIEIDVTKEVSDPERIET